MRAGPYSYARLQAQPYRPRYRRRLGVHLGDAQGSQIGGELGSIIGNIVPIPGIGEVASFIGGLFGPSEHFTPSGLTFGQSFCAFWTAYFQMYGLINQVRSVLKLPPEPPQDFVGNCTPTPSYGGSVSDHNNPMFGPLLAKLLNNPSYASATSADPIIALQSQGVVDQGTAMMNQIIQHLTFTLNAIQSGLLVPQNGVLVPPPASPPPPPPPQSYDAQQNVPAVPATSTSYEAMQAPPMMPAPYLVPYTSDTGARGYFDPQTDTQYTPNAQGQYVDAAGQAMPQVPQTAAPTQWIAGVPNWAVLAAGGLLAVVVIRRI